MTGKGTKAGRAGKAGKAPMVPLLLLGAGLMVGVGTVVYFREQAGTAQHAPASRAPMPRAFQSLSRQEIAQRTAAHQERWRNEGGLDAYCAKSPNHPRCQGRSNVSSNLSGPSLGYINFGSPSDADRARKAVGKLAIGQAQDAGGSESPSLLASASRALSNYADKTRKRAKDERELDIAYTRQRQEEDERGEMFFLAGLAALGVLVPLALYKTRKSR